MITIGASESERLKVLFRLLYSSVFFIQVKYSNWDSLSLLLFLSVLLHEVGHALAARRDGVATLRSARTALTNVFNDA